MKNSGLLNFETIQFVRKAIDSDIALQEILNNPQIVAQSLQVKLSSRSIEELTSLRENNIDKELSLPSPKVISILNKIILDGRFINSWQHNLDEVSAQLNISLTPDLREELLSTNIEDLFRNNLHEEPQASVATTAAGVVAAVVVGAAVAHVNTHDEVPVLDFSNVPKF